MIWKTIPGYPRFELSEYGDFRCAIGTNYSKVGPRKSRVMPNRTGPDYRAVTLIDDTGYKKVVSVHCLVALVFLGPMPADKEMVAHNDNNSMNNHYSNLRYATYKENVHDRVKHGTQQFGEDVHSSKLTETEVRAIRMDPRSCSKIATDYGISKSTAHRIKSGRGWKHLKDAA